MNRKKQLFIYFWIIFTVSLFSNTQHGMDWNAFFGKTVNSLILFGLLYLFLKKPIVDFFKKRSEEIEAEVVQLESSVKASREQAEVIKEKINGLDKIIEEIKTEEESKGREIVESIKAESEKKMLKIRNRYRKEMDSRKAILIKQLKQNISAEIIQRFQKRLESEMKDEEHDRILERNIELVGDKFE
jgi:F-type H+-transporting ATPase subunit b